MKLLVDEREQFSTINIVLDDEEILEPAILKDLKMPSVNHKKGIVLSGRAPIWLYAFLVDKAHSTSWVATFDPRQGAIVVESHIPDIKVGAIIDIKYLEY